MKQRIHYLILSSCLLLVLPLTADRVYSQALTSISESDIEALVDASDKAAKKGNVNGVIAAFAPDIKIKLTVLNKGSKKELVGYLDKDQFVLNWRKTMRRKLAYQHERKNIKIKIYDEETAMVTSEVYETVKLREGTIRAASSEVAFISLRNGKLVITSIEASIRIY